jgi:hypothetical protein
MAAAGFAAQAKQAIQMQCKNLDRGVGPRHVRRSVAPAQRAYWDLHRDDP